MSNGKNASPIGDRFEAPRPAFQAPANAELMTPARKDTTPAKPLDQQVQENDEVAARIAAINKKLELQKQRAIAKREGKTLPPAQRKTKNSGPVTHIVVVGPFGPEHVCKTNEEFIVRTRSSDIHSPEMKALFWANGGETYMKAGLGYAAAFSNLRNDKQKSIKK